MVTPDTDGKSRAGPLVIIFPKWVATTYPVGEYAKMMSYLRDLADARQIRVSPTDEIGRRVSCLGPDGQVRYVPFDYVVRMTEDRYKFVELQAVDNDTLLTVTSRGRYWLDQWQKRKKECPTT